MRNFFGIIVIILTCCMSACSTSETHYAPVMDINTIDPIPQAGTHRVATGETLYSIAWRYGLDYRYVAKRNHIDPPYRILTGQIIYLTGHMPMKSMPAKPQVTAPMPRSEKEPTAPVSYWQWPAHGRVIKTFSDLNKGINIKGKLGDPIYATAPGKVVYSGSGLRGYGNLIIIKHNSLFLTAYAHNSRVIVTEGQWVKRGQQIAKMGSTGTQRVMLHFEIRRGGKPMNPLLYLAKSKGR